jgi:heme oxygenase
MRMPDLATTDADLSAHLRAATAALHARAELRLGLPDAIQDRQDYCRLLARFLGLYAPLERSFHRFGDWEALDIVLAYRTHASGLSRDLSRLGTDPDRVPRALPAMMPDLPTFPHALGALYVMEGATLGGRVILRAVEARLGRQIAGATCFLGGRGAQTGPMWQSFRAALDRFGHANPHLRAEVVIGADRMFQAILTWFARQDGIGAQQI